MTPNAFVSRKSRQSGFCRALDKNTIFYGPIRSSILRICPGARHIAPPRGAQMHYGLELAERGFVTLSPDYPLLASRTGMRPPAELGWERWPLPASPETCWDIPKPRNNRVNVLRLYTKTRPKPTRKPETEIEPIDAAMSSLTVRVYANQIRAPPARRSSLRSVHGRSTVIFHRVGPTRAHNRIIV
jgi:hypothetical protein